MGEWHLSRSDIGHRAAGTVGHRAVGTEAVKRKDMSTQDWRAINRGNVRRGRAEGLQALNSEPDVCNMIMIIYIKGLLEP